MFRAVQGQERSPGNLLGKQGCSVVGLVREQSRGFLDLHTVSPSGSRNAAGQFVVHSPWQCVPREAR